MFDCSIPASGYAIRTLRVEALLSPFTLSLFTRIRLPWESLGIQDFILEMSGKLQGEGDWRRACFINSEQCNEAT